LRLWKGLCGGVWRRKRAGVQRNQKAMPGNRPSDSASAESAETFPLSPAAPRECGNVPSVPGRRPESAETFRLSPVAVPTARPAAISRPRRGTSPKCGSRCGHRQGRRGFCGSRPRCRCGPHAWAGITRVKGAKSSGSEPAIGCRSSGPAGPAPRINPSDTYKQPRRLPPSCPCSTN
jgi:hypothetical protein